MLFQGPVNLHEHVLLFLDFVELASPIGVPAALLLVPRQNRESQEE